MGSLSNDLQVQVGYILMLWVSAVPHILLPPKLPTVTYVSRILS